jgi:hypothetical protein
VQVAWLVLLLLLHGQAAGGCSRQVLVWYHGR